MSACPVCLVPHCPDCYAPIDSAEHHAECIAPLDLLDGGAA